ncbi:TPA: hypothetical protein ACQGUZ_006458, partial [Pseudomonas aeruginosa]
GTPTSTAPFLLISRGCEMAEEINIDMERYHSTAGDPPRRDADVKRQEAQELDELVQQFLAGGGQIEKVGYKMRELPDTFVINPMKTPVYNGALAENSSLKAKAAAPRLEVFHGTR